MTTIIRKPPIESKFHGKFRDLTPNGYKFHRMFAKNYRCYCKSFIGDETISIWQHLGGYIEINDWFHRSIEVVKAIVAADGKLDIFTLDKKNGVVIPWQPEHEWMTQWMQQGLDKADPETRKAAMNAHYDLWRVGHVCEELQDEVLAMVNRGWIQLNVG
jgi:hypothetical protein